MLLMMPLLRLLQLKLLRPKSNNRLHSQNKKKRPNLQMINRMLRRVKLSKVLKQQSLMPMRSQQQHQLQQHLLLLLPQQPKETLINKQKTPPKQPLKQLKLM